jgi:Uncharacterised nucleotidyltransferase
MGKRRDLPKLVWARSRQVRRPTPNSRSVNEPAFRAECSCYAVLASPLSCLTPVAEGYGRLPGLAMLDPPGSEIASGGARVAGVTRGRRSDAASHEAGEFEAVAYVNSAIQRVVAGVPLPSPPHGAAWLRYAEWHGVAPLFLSRADDSLRELWHDAVHNLALSQLRSVADLSQLQRVLEDAEIDFLVFKGPTLRHGVYENPLSRAYGDIDALTPPDQFREAIAALELNGFALLDRNWPMIADRKQGQLSLRMPRGTSLDLHWSILNSVRTRREVNAPTSELFQHARSVQIDGLDIRTLGATDTVIHLALHACQNGAGRLRWLLDLHSGLLANQPTREQLYERAIGMRLHLAVEAAVQQVVMSVDPTVARWLPSTASVWPRVGAALRKRRPPGSAWRGQFSADAFYKSLRGSTTQSATSLVRHTLSLHLPTGDRRAVADLRRHEPSPSAMREFFDYVARQG